VIEIEDSDFDDMNIPDFILDELKSGVVAGKKTAAKAPSHKPIQE